MTPWKPGDPVACGAVYLPDKKTKAAYAEAVRMLWLEPAARHCMSLTTIQARRAFINSYKSPDRERLMDRVRELWEAK